MSTEEGAVREYEGRDGQAGDDTGRDPKPSEEQRAGSPARAPALVSRPAAERERESVTATPTRPRPAAGDDVALDVDHIQLDELALDLQATVGVEHLKLEAKSLDAELHLTANLENVVALVDSAGRRTPSIVESIGRQSGGDRGDGAGIRGELEAALGSARSAYSTVRTAYTHLVGEEEAQPQGQRTRRDDAGDGAENGSGRHGSRLKPVGGRWPWRRPGRQRAPSRTARASAPPGRRLGWRAS